MSDTFCVTITHCKTDPDKATLGFVVANAAQGSEKETLVFLSSDGVWCAVPEEIAKVDEGAPSHLSKISWTNSFRPAEKFMSAPPA